MTVATTSDKTVARVSALETEPEHVMDTHLFTADRLPLHNGAAGMKPQRVPKRALPWQHDKRFPRVPATCTLPQGASAYGASPYAPGCGVSWRALNTAQIEPTRRS